MEIKKRPQKIETVANGTNATGSSAQVMKKERSKLALWISPCTTIYYSILECIYRFMQLRFTIMKHKRVFFWVSMMILTMFILDFIDGPHTEFFRRFKRTSLWWGWWIWLGFLSSCGFGTGLHTFVLYLFFRRFKRTSLWWGWWIWLGFLSSCGFGTGLHTFVLYLGPFIADVTMSAYECGTLNFPDPPYPERIVCPETSDIQEVSFWRLVRKVQLECILWGIGTAIGELPPYFMARQARLSDRHDDEELEELEELIATDQASDPSIEKHISIQKRIELLLHRLIIRAGFFGILLCASIPNPLFDLAGMTCGHFLVPFWSFFGATAIGKAVFKVHLQQFFVIALSSEHHVESMVRLMGRIPFFGIKLQTPLLEFLKLQKAKLHLKAAPTEQTWIQSLLAVIIVGCICSFLVSLINAFAKSYHRRLCDWQRMADKSMEDTKS